MYELWLRSYWKDSNNERPYGFKSRCLINWLNKLGRTWLPCNRFSSWYRRHLINFRIRAKFIRCCYSNDALKIELRRCDQRYWYVRRPQSSNCSFGWKYGLLQMPKLWWEAPNIRTGIYKSNQIKLWNQEFLRSPDCWRNCINERLWYSFCS